MTHPAPTPPTNVESTNPYKGLDRGLFLHEGKCLRVSKARWTCRGPYSALSQLQFQLRSYSQIPTTVNELKAGTLVQTPAGGYWFDCLVRGSVESPILAEYWAGDIYRKHYSLRGQLLSPVEKTWMDEQAQELTTLMGGYAGLLGIEYVVEFDTLEGALEKSGSRMSVEYTKYDQTTTSVLENPVVDDPVVHALKYIYSQ